MDKPETPKRTGIVCPACHQAIATVGRIGPQGLSLNCPGCGHQWFARDGVKS